MGQSFAVLDMYLLSGIIDSYLASSSSQPLHGVTVIDLGILRAYDKKEVGWAAAEMEASFKAALQSKKRHQAEKNNEALLVMSAVLVNDKHWLLTAIRIPSKFWGGSRKKKNFPCSAVNGRNGDDDNDNGHLIELFCANSSNEARVRSLSDLQQQYEIKRILPAMRTACQETILPHHTFVGEGGTAAAMEGRVGENKKKMKRKKGNENATSATEEGIASTAADNHSSRRPSPFFFGYVQGLQYGNQGCGFSCALNKVRLLRGHFVNRRIRSGDRKTKKVKKEFRVDGEIITFEEEEFDKSRSIDRSIRTSKAEEAALRACLYHSLKQRREIAAELRIVTKRKLCKYNDFNS
eukprot:CAMPEP_0185257884 /NCGR_PEP_ID=MMETSP1359-20130426/6900_1 /TAXON_ID=552665 /ORGANISM="Bigelowiella longifila, Strain CCMP242" /LENGTH=350 /DNA_ID=CAMNT_0027843169 /DNA_START=129 /DNA_END=1181 /DNA_ORIENTATION=+